MSPERITYDEALTEIQGSRVYDENPHLDPSTMGSWTQRLNMEAASGRPLNGFLTKVAVNDPGHVYARLPFREKRADTLKQPLVARQSVNTVGHGPL